ncbi:hypothetical protein TYRP_018251 [Tyrophagus putrescentiae]|nr:hypothetical protein TYRP_018251 [Tyrophagus putrescentiae]
MQLYCTTKRYKLLIDSKHQELYSAFTSWADFVLFLDADVVLCIEPYTFANLTSRFEEDWERKVPAHSGAEEGVGHLFWVLTAVLIDARKQFSRRLTFDPVEVEDAAAAEGGHTIPCDDIIAFAKLAHTAEIELYIDSWHVYGYSPLPLFFDSGKEEVQLRQTLLEVEQEALIEGRQFPVASTLQFYIEPVHKGEDERLGVNAVYIIILEEDVRFKRNFCAKWATAWARFEELQSKEGAQYDFLYLVRKLNGDPALDDAVDSTFVCPGYFHWTIGYLVTRSGIEKLLRVSPLRRMIPQLIISPTHYVADAAYISNTEQSNEVHSKKSQPN